MASSTRATRSQVGKKQTKISTFGSIIKTAPAAIGNKIYQTKVAPAVQGTVAGESWTGAGKKRRYEAVYDEETCSSYKQATLPLFKKPRIQPPSSDTSSQASTDDNASPASSQSSCTTLGSIRASQDVAGEPITVANLPSSLKTLLALHEFFLKALSIHFAHNGLAVPAELSSLLRTITCLWKKRTVRKEDIQRLLALYEVSENDGSAVFQPGCTIPHKEAPFQLTSSGAAGSMRVCVEYVGARGMHVEGNVRHPFSEKDLQYLFELGLLCLYRASRHKSNTHLAFLCGTLGEFPLLSCKIGTQSATRQEKASARRTEILSLSNASQQRPQQKKLTTQADPFAAFVDQPENEVAQAVKSRTQSLFDRIAARQAIDTTSSATAAASIARRHAVGRIGEIVEILRMKQQQKSVGRNHLLSDSDSTSPTKLGQRVSFSMNQLQLDIKDSASVPIGGEEIRLCLKILANEGITRNWLKILESGVGKGKSAFVVLEGRGIPGRDVQTAIEGKAV